MDYKYEIKKLKEKMMYWFIKHLPKRLKYFIYIDVLAYATTHELRNKVVSEVLAMDALVSYEKAHNIK